MQAREPDDKVVERLRLQQVGDQLRKLCQRCRVKRLELFGSAVTDQFDSVRSDLDVLVEFEDLAPVDYAKAYFDLREGMIELFGCPVDLVTPAAPRNPYLRDRLDSERRLLYAA